MKKLQSLVLCVSMMFLLFAGWLFVPVSAASINDVSQDVTRATASIKTYWNGVLWDSGSGFVIDESGVIVTNYYLVSNAEFITIKVDDEYYYEATILAGHKSWDVALLQIQGENLFALPLADTARDVRIRDPIIVAGNREGEEVIVSRGHVKHITYEEDWNTAEYDLPVIKVDIPFPSWHGGGPLLSLEGEVLGVTFLSYWDYKEPNAAMPVDILHKLIESAENPYYQHQEGELAVMLEWEGEVDLDLLLLDEDFFHEGVAYHYGPSPDIIRGHQGAEWLVFKEYTTKDFSTGTYVVAPYLVGPYAGDIAHAKLTVFFPDGDVEVMEQEISPEYPHDQWYAFILDVDQETIEILDYAGEVYDSPYIHFDPEYIHEEGEFAVVLQWDGDVDLDLEVWTDDYDYINTGYGFGDSPDIFSGYEGEERLILKEYSEHDFTSGRYIFSAFNYGPIIDDPVYAQFKVYFPDGTYEIIQQQDRGIETMYEQWFAVLVDVDREILETLDFYATEEEIPRYVQWHGDPYYTHQEGDLAVVLRWDKDIDMDLEIWSHDFHFLTRSYWQGESHDIFSGFEGEEWFVFKDYGDYDYSQGQYMVSVYNHGMSWTEDVEVSLIVMFPDGEELMIQQELAPFYPYHQWFALEIDVVSGKTEIVDIFADEANIPDYSPSYYYTHEPGEFAVVLQWAQDVDLDLEIFSSDYVFLGRASWFGNSMDIYSGNEGEEWFVFQESYNRDFSSGQYVISVNNQGAPMGEEAEAQLIVLFPDGRKVFLTQEMGTEFPHYQWFALRVDVDNRSIEVLNH